MTQQEVVQHWREGAERALKSARILWEHGDYPMAMFLCHLSVEKALKALFIRDSGKDPPHTHNLSLLAAKLNLPWTDADLDTLFQLTKFSRYGRYDDAAWINQTATEGIVAEWLPRIDSFLSRLQL